MRHIRCFVLAILVAGGFASADGKLPAVFSDNMVLQRDKAVNVWGWADAGEKVTVRFAGKSAEATADEKGKWLAKLDAMPASADPAELTVAGKNTLKFANIRPREEPCQMGAGSDQGQGGGQARAAEADVV